MGCGNCSSGGCAPAGCKSNGSCLTDGGCNKLDVYDWFAGMDMPSNYKPFLVVEIKFKGSRKEFYLNADNLYLEIGDLVSVESGAGGYDVGHVSLTGELVRLQLKAKGETEASVTKKIYRKTTQIEVEKWKMAKELEHETMHQARKIALEMRLSMKLSDVDYQGDKSKATFYYTADGRVDFRELIKRLADTFRVRIEMRQIGMRQEASRLGGIGSCGRELCCTTWLTDFKTVTTSAARYQNLSLNTLKLAGQCGKLKCCLNYELDNYMDALKDIPDDITSLQTQLGTATLLKTDIFKKMMWFAIKGEEHWIPLSIEKVKEIYEMNKKGEKPQNLKDVAIIEEMLSDVPDLDYENVVGQDSITRLDNRDRRKKNNRNTNQQHQSSHKKTTVQPTINANNNTRNNRRNNKPRPNQAGNAPNTNRS